MRQLSPDAKKMLDAIPADGSIGNRTLMRLLDIGDFNDYRVIRDELLEAPAWIGTGRGKGGSVHRVPATSVDQVPIITLSKSEHDLYENFGSNLNIWAQSEGYKNFIIERTAYGGASRDGKWSRPDFTIVAVDQYPFMPGKHVDIITFEVKRGDQWNVDSAYEALSHSASATESYLAIEGERENLLNRWHDDLERLEDACSRNGIGLIYFKDLIGDPFEPEIDPLRRSPHPYEANEFITRHIRSTESREKIRELTR